MARKHSKGSGGGRSKLYRPVAYRVTCQRCHVVSTVPVPPPAGVRLTCLSCLALEKAK